MNILQQIITQFTIFVSLSTACGVLMHDTHVDKAVVSVFSAVDFQGSTGDDGMKTTRIGSSAHTHPEHTSLSSIIHDGSANPRSTPRNDDRKYMKVKRAQGNGGPEFDGQRLCIGKICF